jgi:hypothetical protein
MNEVFTIRQWMFTRNHEELVIMSTTTYDRGMIRIQSRDRHGTILDDMHTKVEARTMWYALLADGWFLNKKEKTYA